MISNNEFTPLSPDSAPGLVVLPIMELPALLSGTVRPENAFPLRGWYMAPTTDDAAERSRAQKASGQSLGLAYAAVPTGHFLRTLAHMGHAFYMGAAADASRENSLLLPIARGDLTFASRVIGGWHSEASPPPRAPGIHQVIPFNVVAGEAGYIGAIIQLFTHLDPSPPVYSVLLCRHTIPQGEKYLSFTLNQATNRVDVEELTMAA